MISNSLFEKVNTGRKAIVAEVKSIPIGTIIDSSGLEFTADHGLCVGKKISVFLAKNRLIPATDNYFEYVHKGHSLFFHSSWLSFVSGVLPPKEASNNKMKIEEPDIMATDLKPEAERAGNVVCSYTVTDIEPIEMQKIKYETSIEEIRRMIQEHSKKTAELLIWVNNLLSFSVLLMNKIQDYKNNGKDNKENIAE